MKHVVRLAALLLGASTLGAAHAVEGYAIWDNFDGATQLNPARWQFGERTRIVEAGAMRVVQRDRGNQSGDSGTYGVSFDSSMKTPAAITQMRSAMTVNDFAVSGCAANASDTSAEARMVGLYFNAGPGVPTSLINDVGAKVRLYRSSNSTDAPGVLRVEGQVFQCTVSDCSTGDIILGTADLGTAALGETVTLKMEWEPANNRFNFVRGSEPVKRINYAVSDAQAPYFLMRAIGTRTRTANCFSGARTEGFIDAKFDKVSVNASAAP